MTTKGRPPLTDDEKAARVAKRKADGAKMRAAREALGLTQGAVAEAAAVVLGRSITKQAVCAWETGRVGTPAAMLEWAAAERDLFS